jgi:hypothetical protein
MPRKGAIVDMTGQRFERLTVVRVHHRDERRRTFWLCRCDCGVETVVERGNLRTGNTSSCGCFRKEKLVAAAKHGHNRPGNRSPEYHSWTSMWARVRDGSGRRWKDYGARGISVCASWASFEVFLRDMGPRPPGTSLDRINNDGPYEPANCRWATQSQQNANQRRSRANRNAA